MKGHQEIPNTSLDSLRPSVFEQFYGQEKAVGRLQLMVEAAQKRGDVLRHILLSGPPGLGKTTLANIIGGTVGTNVKTTSGPLLEKAGDLVGLLTDVPHGGVLFIDEIHRLQPAIEEYLYSAMEDFRLDIVIDQGPSARSIRLNLAKFTLIGATTRSGMISSPLRSRFDMTCRLDYYSVTHLQKIVERSASLLDLPIDAASASEIARRSRGTPRIANNLLHWVRDYAQVRFSGIVTQEIVVRALTMLEIDEEGVDRMDKHILEVLIGKFDGGPVGINSLAVAVGEEVGTLEEVHEPYLIMQGYLQRTAHGRVATARAYQKIGISSPVPHESIPK
ncbi:Holliday junction ATP-dependent DNA helicase RuvB [Candidatus Xiphinematobacter sp. Idaho Grape]|uniref:Holliday junction branch migration DNA helicase RuvB n=1 Tax=Candidatus Xiphinematobacter sp. Idaho Grape TaxID=1704307 RepID=UPI00070672C9|nr:Holliday junction branch migration DNA helicase RuvB [Candidatus Xiphinematobacter sp. Idaho Grape]ALJ56303.1 Holliday junction ATP-dependent DNA helicase RuvB [Candidatus Xiphinematobacter sp. Idaho Grape]